MNRYLVFILSILALSASKCWAVPNSSQVKKADALFARSIEYYKQLRSFEFRAQERIEFPNKKILSSQYYGGMQFGKTVERTFLLWEERESDGEHTISSAQLLNARNFLKKGAAIDKWGSHKVDSLAKRESFAKEIIGARLTMFLSIWSLGTGYNTAKAPKISRILVTREDGLDTVLVERAANKSTTFQLKFGFEPRTGALQKFVLTEKEKGQQTRATLKFSGVKSNWKGSQTATDNAIYNWRYFAPVGFKKPGK